MKGMVTDLQMAGMRQRVFETWQRQNSRSSPLDMSVGVLTTAIWPSTKARLTTLQCVSLTGLVSV